MQTSIKSGPQCRRTLRRPGPEAIRKLKGRPRRVVVVTLTASSRANPAGMRTGVQALRELGDVAAEAGVRILAYNHVNCWNESVPFNVELVKKVNHPQVDSISTSATG